MLLLPMEKRMLVSLNHAACCAGAPSKAYLYKLLKNGRREGFFVEDRGKTYINIGSDSWRSYISSRRKDGWRKPSGVVKTHKRCSCCGWLMPLDWFHKSTNTLDGHAYACKTCVKLKAKNYNLPQRTKKKIYTDEELRDRKRAQDREYYRKNKESINKRCIEYKTRDPEKWKAYRKQYREAHYIPSDRVLKTEEEKRETARSYRDRNRDKVRGWARQQYHKTKAVYNEKRQIERDDLDDAYVRHIIKNRFGVDRDLIDDDFVEGYRAYISGLRTIRSIQFTRSEEDGEQIN